MEDNQVTKDQDYKDEVNNGSALISSDKVISIVDNRIVLKVDPIDKFPVIRSDKKVNLYVDGKKREGPIIVSNEVEITIETIDQSPHSSVDIKVTNDKLKAYLIINKQVGKRLCPILIKDPYNVVDFVITTKEEVLVDDNKIRTFVKKKTAIAGVSKIQIERAAKRIKLNIFTAKPGMIIGKGGQGIDALKTELQKIVTGKTILINIVEVKSAEADAQLMAENVALQLEKRISFRRAMKQTIQRAMKSGIKGVKITCSGRLGGAEIARAESYHEGTIPLQTLRADIDYGFSEAKTTYGKIGVKVWVYKGEILPTKKPVEDKKKANA